ncbi:phage major capsid protein [Neobacillus sp. MER 74]|uniref:phage major capsid protein n=1 Tax=Neobacillus sp. MER 74 TaxID=2939566 RepID=UPI00203B9F28|nr:phage major capsid protein [Neobacillus sp. MER 74]MCM3116848.1 phage major capsid protein [Neobacillus sp. MER 74]
MLKQLQEARLLKRAEEREKHLEEMNTILEGAKKEKRSLTDAENSTFEKLEKQVQQIDSELEKHSTSLEDLMNKMEERDLKIEKTKKADKKQSKEEEIEIRQFVEYVRTGQTRDLASANNGSVIPTTIAQKIVSRVYEISPLIQEATTYEVGENLNLPVYDDTAHVTSFITEFQEIVTSNGTFSSIPLKSQIIGTMAKIGKSLLNRTDLEVLPFIVDACAKSVAKFLENEIINNTNARFASTLANGVTQTQTAATAGTIAPAEVVEMKNSIPSMMLPNAKWLMHKDTLTYLQSLTDANGNFVFGNSLSENNGNVLLGYPVMLSDAMPRMGAGAREIYFGDFREGLAIKIGAQSAEVYRELYASQYAVGVGHFMECDVSASHSTQSISVLVGA